jgi:hypothetical protein
MGVRPLEGQLHEELSWDHSKGLSSKSGWQPKGAPIRVFSPAALGETGLLLARAVAVGQRSL